MKIFLKKSNLLKFKVLSVMLLSVPLIIVAQGEWRGGYLAGYVSPERAYDRPANLRLNEIPGVACRHLNKNYAKAKSIVWTKTADGYSARFAIGGDLYQACYNQSGNFDYAIRYMESKDLYADLAGRLKNEFPGYQMDIVAEINNEVRLVYIITLKNAYEMKSILVREGQIQVIDNLDYAGL